VRYRVSHRLRLTDRPGLPGDSRGREVPPEDASYGRKDGARNRPEFKMAQNGIHRGRSEDAQRTPALLASG
jgi:hypothetical protein